MARQTVTYYPFPATSWRTVLQAKAGSREALGRLFERYKGPLRSFCAYLTRDADKADEIVSDMAMKMVDHNFLRSVNQGRGKLRNLLMKAATNLWRSRLRREQAKAKRWGKRVDVDWELLAARAAEAEEIYEMDCAIRAMDEVLETERRACRERGLEAHMNIFLRHLEAGEKWAEVAAEFGLKEQTAKNMAATAEDRLNKRLWAMIGEDCETRSHILEDIDRWMDLFSERRIRGPRPPSPKTKGQ